MPYATRQDMETRFGPAELAQLADPHATGFIDDGALALALSDAEAEIDAYMVGRYTLPLDTVEPNLVRLACDIARYRLWKDQASEEVRQRYQDATRYLERVASGAILLSNAGIGQTPSASAGAPSYSAPPRVFVDDVLP